MREALALGGLARWRKALWLNPRHGQLALGTLAVNLLGGLLIGAWPARQVV